MKYGQIVTATVYNENDTAYFVQVEGKSFNILKSNIDEPLEKGETVEGLIYETRKGQCVMQLDLPNVRPGYYDWGTVVSVRRDLGVFIDIGLYDKEIVLSMDDLPDNTAIWPKQGDRVYVTYEVDKKNRFWAKLATPLEWEQLIKKAPKRLMNQNISGQILQVKLSGIIAISPECYRLFVHDSELVGAVRIGQSIKGRVIKVHPDGSLNVSMKPRAHEAISDDSSMILALLQKKSDKFLPLHDKSHPDEIQRQLGISKGQFKRSVGQLLKQGQIRIEKDKGIYLI